MGINVTDAASEKSAPSNKLQNLFLACSQRLRELSQCREDQIATIQIAHCQFADDKRVYENSSPIQQQPHLGVVFAEMIDPNRRIDKDHFAGRRRGIRVNFGSLPPRRARRRAASRSIKARSASRTKADFSSSPV